MAVNRHGIVSNASAWLRFGKVSPQKKGTPAVDFHLASVLT